MLDETPPDAARALTTQPHARKSMGQRLRGLNRVLALGQDGGDWRWLIPVSVLVGTILAFVVIGEITSAPVDLYLPNGVVIAVVMSGLAIACMSPDTDDLDSDEPPPGDDDRGPVLGCPGGPWVVVAHMGPAPGRPGGHEERDAQLVTTAGR